MSHLCTIPNHVRAASVPSPRVTGDFGYFSLDASCALCSCCVSSLLLSQVLGLLLLPWEQLKLHHHALCPHLMIMQRSNMGTRYLGTVMCALGWGNAPSGVRALVLSAVSRVAHGIGGAGSQPAPSNITFVTSVQVALSLPVTPLIILPALNFPACSLLAAAPVANAFIR